MSQLSSQLQLCSPGGTPGSAPLAQAQVSSCTWLIADSIANSIAIRVAVLPTGPAAAAEPPSEPSAADEAPQEASLTPGVLDAPIGVGVGVGGAVTALESHSSTLRRPYRTVPVAVRTRYGLLCARLLPLCRFTFEVCGQPQLHRLLTPLVIARAPQPLASQGGAEGGR